MATIGMLVCSFYLKKRFSKKENELLPLNQPYHDKVGGDKEIEYDNIFEMLSAFCVENEALSDFSKQQKVFSVKQDSYRTGNTTTYRYCSFVVRSGNYGTEGEITDRRTQEITYRKNENEADIKEFQVVAYVPKDVGGIHIEKGILVFQSIATYGIKTITVENFRTFFSNINLTFETRSVSVNAFIEKLVEQGSLRKITLINNRVSPNSADNMLISTGHEERSFIRPKLKQEWFRQMLGVIGRASETGVVELPDGEEYDDISFQFKLGRQYRTVRLRNLEKLSIVEEVPDKYVRGQDASVLIDYMVQTAEEYKEKMVFSKMEV